MNTALARVDFRLTMYMQYLYIAANVYRMMKHKRFTMNFLYLFDKFSSKQSLHGVANCQRCIDALYDDEAYRFVMTMTTL